MLSLAPQFEKVEHVTAGFSWHYIARNLSSDLTYLFNPMIFPILITVLASLALLRKSPQRLLLFLWFGSIFGVYLCFYAGSFDLNPRYSIQIAAPLILLALSIATPRLALTALLLSAVVAHIRPFNLPDYVQVLGEDHRAAMKFADGIDRNTLVLTTEPEEFLNHGLSAMNAVYASEQPAKLRDEAKNFKAVVYYAGVRTNQEGSLEQLADRWVKSNFQLHLIDTQQIRGTRISYYELLF